jgi:hypothetical protein
VSFGEQRKREKKIRDFSRYIILAEREKEKRDRHSHFVERGTSLTTYIKIMTLELTLSCDSDKTESGPTLVHSTGVEHYKIPPEVVGTIE